MAGDYFREPGPASSDPNQRRRPQPGGPIEFGNYPDAFGQHGAPFAGAVQVSPPGSGRSIWVDQMHLNEDGSFRNGLGFQDFDPSFLAFKQAELDRESAQARADARMAEIARANMPPPVVMPATQQPEQGRTWPSDQPNPGPEELQAMGQAMLNSRGTRDAEFPYSDADGRVINAPDIGRGGVPSPEVEAAYNARHGRAGGAIPLPEIGQAGVPDDTTIQSYNRAAIVRAINGQSPQVGQTRPNEQGETFPVVGHITRLDGVNVPMVNMDGAIRIYNPATGDYEDVSAPEWAAFIAGGGMPGR